MVEYYIIPGPKYWSIKDANYVSVIPEDAMRQELYNGDDLMAEDNLRDWLRGMGLSLGELVPVEEARAVKLAEVMTGYSAAFAPIESIYPVEERETWPVQLEEARAVLADPGADTPMLSILVATRGLGETVQDFALIVMGNNAMYRQFAAFITGQQQRMYREVNELQTTAAIQAYEVVYQMPEGLGYGGVYPG